MSIFPDILICVVAGTISNVLFSIIFVGINQSRLKLFVPLQKLVAKVKRKSLFKVIAFLFWITVSVAIQDFYHLGYMGFGVLLGFFSSLIDVIFGTGFGKFTNQNM